MVNIWSYVMNPTLLAAQHTEDLYLKNLLITGNFSFRPGSYLIELQICLCTQLLCDCYVKQSAILDLLLLTTFIHISSGHCHCLAGVTKVGITAEMVFVDIAFQERVALNLEDVHTSKYRTCDAAIMCACLHS